MDPLTINAAGGSRSRLESLDLLANNLANGTTAGYKADREAFSLYQPEDAQTAEFQIPADSLPLVEKRWTDLRQGTIQSTGNPLDLALSGPGFFVVDGPSGRLHTRDGALHLTRDGKLVTRDGYEMTTREPRRIRADSSLPVQIDTDGTVRQSGVVLGHLEIAAPPGPDRIEKSESGYFSWAGAAASPAPTEIHQGALEASNANPAEGAVRLVNLLRQFESLQRAIQIGAEMNRRAVEDVARTGS